MRVVRLRVDTQAVAVRQSALATQRARRGRARASVQQRPDRPSPGEEAVRARGDGQVGAERLATAPAIWSQNPDDDSNPAAIAALAAAWLLVMHAVDVYYLVIPEVSRATQRKYDPRPLRWVTPYVAAQFVLVAAATTAFLFGIGSMSVVSAALRYHTADTMSHGATALGITVALDLALRGRALVAGLAIGLVAATRPVSAVAIALVGLVILKRVRFIAVLAGVGLFIGYWDTVMNYWEKWTQAGHAHARELEPGKEFYCPMDPQVVRSTYEPNGDVPKCPICGMDLVPVEEEAPPAATPAPGAKKERKIKYWVSPMDPGYIRDKPGKEGKSFVPQACDVIEGSHELGHIFGRDRFEVVDHPTAVFIFPIVG